ncbi:hypothetical protein [Arthrobacter sp. TMS1-12-1]
MIIDVVGLLATAILLFTLVGLEFRRVGPDSVPRSAGDRRPARHVARPGVLSRLAPADVLPRVAAAAGMRRQDGRHQRPVVRTRTTGGVLVDLAGTVSRRGVAVMWTMFLLLVLPRVMGLLL